MKDVKLYGIYTISPLHYGTGQTAGAVDLPVARESHTGLPFIPGTGLKGVARDMVEQSNKNDQEYAETLFGSQPPQPGGAQDDTAAPNEEPNQEAGGGAGTSSKSKDGAKLKAGNLLFTDARLLALPVRSLQRPFLYVTSPLVLQRLERELNAYEIRDVLPESWVRPKPRGNADDGSGTGDERQALVADTNLAGHPLVLEDLCYDAGHVLHLDMVEKLAKRFVELLAHGEALGRDLMPSGLVVVPDEDLRDLAQRTLPVVARTQLTPGKTTDKWKDDRGLYGPPGKEYSGNLWYEEALPADTLLYAFVGAPDLDRSRKGAEKPTEELKKQADKLKRIQIGGNETVGAGQCWWTFWPAGVAASEPAGVAASREGESNGQ